MKIIKTKNFFQNPWFGQNSFPAKINHKTRLVNTYSLFTKNYKQYYIKYLKD